MIIYWIGGISGIKTKVKIIFLLLQLLITSIIIKTINFFVLLLYAHDVGIPRHLRWDIHHPWDVMDVLLLNQVPTCIR
jgi:hypothetical protein